MGETKTVVITGGAKGIGASISHVYHTAGYRVFVASRTDNGFVDQLGEGAIFVATDVCRPEQLDRLVKTAIDESGRIDAFINNAGYSEWKPLMDIDENFWNRMIDTNLKSVLFGCQAAAKYMNAGACIVNVSSLAGKRGSANNSVYCASKFGVNGLTQALAKELGPRKIRVNAVCPVYVRTEGLLAALADVNSPASGIEIDKYLIEFSRTNAALQTLPTGEEIGSACLFLTSEAASAITGQCINVDCGVLPQ